jgi:hypothetical protein
MINENDKCNFLHKIIDETKSGKLSWVRNWSAEPEYGTGYIYSAVIKNNINLEIFRYRNDNFMMGDVLPSFKLYVGNHNSKYISEQNDSCHKLLINICILIDSIIQNDSDQIILDYLK